MEKQFDETYFCDQISHILTKQIAKFLKIHSIHSIEVICLDIDPFGMVGKRIGRSCDQNESCLITTLAHIMLKISFYEIKNIVSELSLSQILTWTT